MFLDKCSALIKDKRFSVIAPGDKAAALTCTPAERRSPTDGSAHGVIKDWRSISCKGSERSVAPL